MLKRIFVIMVLGSVALMLTNCSAVYQGARQTIVDDSSPNWDDYSPVCDDYSPTAAMLAITPKSLSLSRTPVSSGWERLMEIGPGSDAFLTLTDGTLRGGQIVEVHSDKLIMMVAGQDMTIARTDIALVKIKRSSGTLAGGLIGFAVSGVTLTAIICGEADGCSGEGWVVGITLLGIPGGLLGALIGSQIGGDEEIIP
jgi:hypothetical protein